MTFNQYAKVLAYSQWGEDGIIREIFRRIRPVNMTCFEFGAADGLFFSNTANLWFNEGWGALLVESDPKKYDQLLLNVSGMSNVRSVLGKVDRIDRFAPEPMDLISIDVDGEEYGLFHEMEVRHRVVIVEHNPTIPHHLSIVGGNGTGSSARALVELADTKQYRFLTATLTNCVFVADELFAPFTEFDTGLETNFDDKHVCYAYTDYRGNPTLVGDFPYGLTR